jgi:hypothetical protein
MNKAYKRKLTSAIPLETIAKKIKTGKDNTNNHISHHIGYHNQNIHNKNNKKNNNNKFNQSYLSHQKKDKETIPKRIREIVWSTYNGEKYTSKCYVSWCSNFINVFNYQVGHDIPESKGGTMDIGNLRPICGNCNQSMGNKYTIQEWSKLVDTQEQSMTIESNIPAKVDTSNSTSNYRENIQKPEKIKQLQDFLTNYLQLDNNLNKELDKQIKNNKNMNSTAKLSLIAVLVLALNLILF